MANPEGNVLVSSSFSFHGYSNASVRRFASAREIEEVIRKQLSGFSLEDFFYRGYQIKHGGENSLAYRELATSYSRVQRENAILRQKIETGKPFKTLT